MMITRTGRRFPSTVLVSIVALLAMGLSASAADVADPQEVLVEDFDATAGQLPNGWQAVIGSWSVVDGGLVADGVAGGGLITFGDPSWQNYEIEATATFLEVHDDTAWLGLAVRAATDSTPTWAQFTLRQKTTRGDGVEFAVRADGNWIVRQRFGAKVDCPIGRPIPVRAVVLSTSVQGWTNGQRAIDCPFCLERENGRAGLAVHGCRVRFDDVKLRRLPDTALPPREPKVCEVVAHRGFSAVAPENTLASARKAIEVKANGSEFDVYRCKDGPLVIMHDEEVKRTTNGAGKITGMTLAEIKKLDAGSWKDKTFAGETVPTLVELLTLLKDSGSAAVIEIKMAGISEQVVQAVREAGMLEQAYVISFKADVVKEVRQLEPKLPCAWLSSDPLEGTPAQRADQIAQKAKDCGTDYVDLYYQLLSPEVVAELKQRGLHVWCWTVDDPILMTALSAWGVDSITTNRPDLARQQLPQPAVGK
jgi:glycerophosphoryl diester phosphodiesterase